MVMKNVAYATCGICICCAIVVMSDVENDAMCCDARCQVV